MNFNDLDKKMRVFETSMDQTIIPGVYIVARLDGRGFTRLTKEVLNLERPFDLRFRDVMSETVTHLMQCGFRILYGYTESDEISLLFHQEENLFDRKVRKIQSILAGEASAKFSMGMGTMGVFDCRICPLPNQDLVIDYFRWRQEDAHRNSLNAWCYWRLRASGKSKSEATAYISGMSVSDKNELLFQLGTNFNELPLWQKRGTGFYYEVLSKEAVNPLTGDMVKAVRKRIRKDDLLPIGEEYGRLLFKVINNI